MLDRSNVIAFVATARPDESRAFYANVLGLRLVADIPAAIVFDANGVMLRVAKVQAHTPAPHTILGWQVADISATVQALATRGVTFERFSGFDQDDAGIWTSPDRARIAWFKDPDGNTLSLTEFPR